MTLAAARNGTRPRVLMLSPFFLPAKQGGGSVQAVLNLTQHLSASFEFVVATRDHDLRDPHPFDEVARQAVRQSSGLDIRYLPQGYAGALAMTRLLRERFDLVYLHSLMAPDLALWPLVLLRFRGLPRCPLLIAPRGELMPGAMAHRAGAKRLYLGVLRAFGLLCKAQFHATTAEEADAIQARLCARATVHVAPDLPPVNAGNAAGKAAEPRAPGPLRVLFLSRIDPVKNLRFALEVLAGLTCEVEFNIAGPIGNAKVWAECLQRMRSLPAHVQARYLGAVPHADVAALMAAHDVFFLPTLGENHGYVVAEALAAGCPVLLSDRTPWRDLQAHGVGADLPLADPSAFQRLLLEQAKLSDKQRAEQRARCRAYAHERLHADDAVQASRAMLERVLHPNARMFSTNTGQAGGR